MVVLRSLCVFFVVITLSSCSKYTPKNPFSFIGKTMGTTYSIKGHGPFGGLKEQEIKENVDRALKRINLLMSTYIKDSEISKFNRHFSTEPFAISKELQTVVIASDEIGHFSQGAFDITISPLVNLWGFGPKEFTKVPTREKIQETLQTVGYQKLGILHDPPRLQKKNPELRIDLSAIAKGYGVDYIARLLDGFQVDNYMVEIGGEVTTKGVNYQGKPWGIAVEVPNVKTRELGRILALRDVSVATSGDYRNYFEKDGRRYSHTISPITGEPITHHLASVTVVHKSCMKADGWATALNVMGFEKGSKVAKALSLPVMFIVKTKDGFEEMMTDQFKKYLR